MKAGKRVSLAAWTARSVSPVKALGARRASLCAEVPSRQRFIHQFLTKETTGHPESERKGSTTDINKGQVKDKPTAEEECCIYQVTKPVDVRANLQEWLDTLGGTVDVVPNGHCGWMAFYGAYTNTSRNVQITCATTIDEANLLKKDILNGMIASMQAEFTLHPVELVAELAASGHGNLTDAPEDVRLCALANYYAAQRNKSAKTGSAHTPLASDSTH
ncbi:hypothetical protein DVH05_016878 [Phytophthora capsici]|nr:hypothetical protein DVH05_016878 [Phytophthora capsici]